MIRAESYSGLLLGAVVPTGDVDQRSGMRVTSECRPLRWRESQRMRRMLGSIQGVKVRIIARDAHCDQCAMPAGAGVDLQQEFSRNPIVVVIT